MKLQMNIILQLIIVFKIVPVIFDTLVSILRPVMDEEFRKSLQLLRRDRKLLQSTVKEWIDPDKLTWEFGGNKF
jgi:hypothetical protein